MKTINDFLQWMGVSNGSVDSVRKNVINGVSIALAIFTLVVLLAISVLFGVFFWLGSYVHTLTGLDMPIAKVISLLILIVFFGTPIKGFVWSFLPIIPRKDKKKKRAIFLLTLAVFFSISYFTSRGVYFNPETGKSLQYYSIGLKGEYKFYSSDGYDPVTGAKLLPATPDVIRKYKAFIDSTENPVHDASVGIIKEISNEYHENLKDEYKNEEVISNDSKNNTNDNISKEKPTSVIVDNKVLPKVQNTPHFYPATFVNYSTEVLYLCITPGDFTKSASYKKILNRESSVLDLGRNILIKKMTEGMKYVVDLREGRHLFSILSVHCDFTYNVQSNRENFSIHDDTSFLVQFIAGNQMFNPVNTFYLDVTPDKNQSVQISIKNAIRNSRKYSGVIEDSESFDSSVRNYHQGADMVNNDIIDDNDIPVVDKNAGVTIAGDNSIKKNIKHSGDIKKIIKYIEKNTKDGEDGISIKNLDKDSELYKIMYGSGDTHGAIGR